MNRENYEWQLRERQKRHLESLKFQKDIEWQPCAHDGCSECVGTGLKKDGTSCVHFISCQCPKCKTVFF